MASQMDSSYSQHSYPPSNAPLLPPPPPDSQFGSYAAPDESSRYTQHTYSFRGDHHPNHYQSNNRRPFDNSSVAPSHVSAVTMHTSNTPPPGQVGGSIMGGRNEQSRL